MNIASSINAHDLVTTLSVIEDLIATFILIIFVKINKTDEKDFTSVREESSRRSGN